MLRYNKYPQSSLQIPKLLKITVHQHQPTEISDDQLLKSFRSLNKMQRKTYNRVLS